MKKKSKIITGALVLAVLVIGGAVALVSADNHAAAVKSRSPQTAQADENAAIKADNFVSFDKKWAYEGSGLGATYSRGLTTFKVWAPTAKEVHLISYGKNDDPNAPIVKTYEMTRGTVAAPNDHAKNTIGLWTLTISGDQSGLVYDYQVNLANGKTDIAQDPYSIAVTEGGQRSVVESPSALTPKGFTAAQGSAASWRVSTPTKAMVDEMHIRDLTISPSSGVPADLRGKFLGVIADGKNAAGQPTGLTYLKDEGFNYVQIQPMAEFASVTETGNPADGAIYNWGYDPENYNVPEGEYATNAVNPVTRVLEAKEMIQGIHQKGMGVIMDVVYNHVYSQPDSSFEKIVPGYYFRNSDGSQCGNDTASNHEMFQKYIIDSVTYWAKNYDVDGFRFDIMANIDISTMNKVRAALNKIDPHIITYGEGWQMSTDLPESEMSMEALAYKLPGIGFFNDAERNAINSNFATEGFYANGNLETVIAEALAGSQKLEPYTSPIQSVNYVECHDGLNLNDLTWQNNSSDTPAQHVQRVQFANAVNILAQGITFMEVGQEFDRSKIPDGTPYDKASSADQANASNSYNAGDKVNQVNWNLETQNAASVKYISQLLHFRADNPSFTLNSYSTINKDMKFLSTKDGSGVVTYEVTQGTDKFLIVLNASKKPLTVGKGALDNIDLSHATMLVSNDSTWSGKETQGIGADQITLSDLTASIIKL